MSLASAKQLALALVEPTVIFWLSGTIWLFLGAKVHLFSSLSARSLPWTSTFGIPLGVGLILRYAFELMTGNSLIADGLCLLCAAAAVPVAFMSTPDMLRTMRSAMTPRLLVFPALWLPLAYLCVVYPVIDGDAKEIWFFHAKMIFYGKGVNSSAGFQDSGIIFSHPDYPKLVPVLAATIANFAGSWNDYLPKFAVALVWAPLFCLAADLFIIKRWREALLLLVAAMSGAGFLLFNGYMDGPLAGWCAGLAGASWLIANRRDNGMGHRDMQSLAAFSGLALTMILNLKFEGLPLAIIMIASLAFVFHKQRLPIAAMTLTAAPGLVTFLIWRFLCLKWNLSNDMASDPFSSWTRLKIRFSDQSSWEMLHETFSIFLAPWWIWLPGGILITMAWIRNPRDPGLRHITGVYFSALVYAAFMFVVYMTTHHDLAWHLKFSAIRTLLPAQTILMMAFGSLMLGQTEGHGR